MSEYYRKVLYINGMYGNQVYTGRGFARLKNSINGGMLEFGIRDITATQFGNYRLGFFGVRDNIVYAVEIKKEVLFKEEELREIEYASDLSEMIYEGVIDGILLQGERNTIFYSDSEKLYDGDQFLLETSLIWKKSFERPGFDTVIPEDILTDIGRNLPKLEKEESIQNSTEMVAAEVGSVEIPDFLRTKKADNKLKREKMSGGLNTIKIVDWTDLFKKYDLVEPFAEKEFYDCVEINYDDLKYLPIDGKELHNNSFLLHGLYRFQHILLGKYKGKKKQKRYILGVPGAYDRSEKILAPTFGFEYFKLARREGIQCMNFGYWFTFFN